MIDVRSYAYSILLTSHVWQTSWMVISRNVVVASVFPLCRFTNSIQHQPEALKATRDFSNRKINKVKQLMCGGFFLHQMKLICRFVHMLSNGIHLEVNGVLVITPQ